MVVDCFTTDLLCMRLCSELSQAESNPRQCKAGVGLSIWSSRTTTHLEGPSAWREAIQASVFSEASRESPDDDDARPQWEKSGASVRRQPPPATLGGP